MSDQDNAAAGDLQAEYNLEDVVTGNADSIIAKLGDIGTGDLPKLRALEGAMPKPRTSVLGAIDAELAGRADVVTDAVLQQTLDAQAAKIAELEQRNDVLEAIATRLSEGLFNRDLLVDGEAYMLPEKVFLVIDAQQVKINQLTGQSDTAKQRVADLEGAAADAANSAQANAPKPVALTPAESAPDLSGVDELRVLCVDEDGKSLPALPPLLFQAHQFMAENGALVLDAPIAFARELPETQVHGLFALIDGAKKVGLQCRLVQPIWVGGGKATELPKGHLAFVAKPKADA